MRITSCVATALLLIGCTTKQPTTATISPGSATVTNATGSTSATSQWSRAPAAVQSSFAESHPNAAVQRVKPHMAADGSVHYLVTFTDANGHRDQAEYLDDGSVIVTNSK